MKYDPLMNTHSNAAASSSSHAFSFGDPEPVLSNNAADYLGTFIDMTGRYYRPPVSLTGLADIMNANAHHNAILHFKKNQILKYFIPSKQISAKDMQRFALDYFVTGNFYPQLKKNKFKKALRAEHLPAISMRRGVEKGVFFKLNKDGSEIEFEHDEVIQIQAPDIKQSIYGLPEYMGGIQSVLLSEESGLFRRKYYSNGAHMGYILVTNDAGLDDKTAKMIEQKVKSSKGPGNFRSLYLNIGQSKSKEPVQIIPVGDIGTKDEFDKIKSVTLREILAMHRTYAALTGIMPENAGGFGDILKIMQVHYELEVEPMLQPFLELNDYLGPNAVRFKEPNWKTEQSA